jgi:hypothetical protein
MVKLEGEKSTLRKKPFHDPPAHEKPERSASLLTMQLILLIRSVMIASRYFSGKGRTHVHTAFQLQKKTTCPQPGMSAREEFFITL